MGILCEFYWSEMEQIRANRQKRLSSSSLKTQFRIERFVEYNISVDNTVNLTFIASNLC